MAGRTQQDQQLLSPPQLQAISVAVADAVTQALAQSGSGNQGPAAQPGPSMSCNPRGLYTREWIKVHLAKYNL